MRTILASLLLVIVTSNHALGQEVQKKAVPIKADFSFFEDDWGMKLKAFSLELVHLKSKTGDTMVVGRITYVLEFDKDVLNQDLDNLQSIFVDKSRRLRHIFFDQDHIAINPFVAFGYRIQGDISGVRGEAIRVVVDIEYDAEIILNNAKKLVVRPG